MPLRRFVIGPKQCESSSRFESVLVGCERLIVVGTRSATRISIRSFGAGRGRTQGEPWSLSIPTFQTYSDTKKAVARNCLPKAQRCFTKPHDARVSYSIWLGLSMSLVVLVHTKRPVASDGRPAGVNPKYARIAMTAAVAPINSAHRLKRSCRPNEPMYCSPSWVWGKS